MDFFYLSLSGFGAYFESFVPFKKAVQHQYLFFFWGQGGQLPRIKHHFFEEFEGADLTEAAAKWRFAQKWYESLREVSVYFRS